MRAIVLTQHGSLQQLSLADRPLPDIGPEEVLLQIEAAALNRLDLWVIEGWSALELDFPHILGSDGAGVIAALGDGVTDFEVGDRVVVNPTRSCGVCNFCRSGRDHMCNHFAIFGEHIPGFYAEFQAVPARNLVRIPDGISASTAAAAALVYVTAWHSLIDAGHFRPGESILIVGASGGVNLATIDIARLSGAGAVYVIGSSEQKLEAARACGADVTINRNESDWGRAVYKATGRKGVDVVVDNVGQATYMTSLRCLKKGGRLLTVGNTSGPELTFDNRYMFARHLSIIGTTMGPHATFQKVMNLIFSGQLHPVIDQVYPLDEAKLALERLAAGEAIGKLVLDVAV
ncbi:MAG: zinc-binding dehydrogenase [Candidatus Promineifilaceae bacterium]|nr:zinc-binding dehydrogenase [Candidatus Promineifilaceae bacterium]